MNTPNFNIMKKTNPKIIVEPGMIAKIIEVCKMKHLWVTLYTSSWETKLKKMLETYNAQIVKLDVFGRGDKFNRIMSRIGKLYGELPVNWIDCGSCYGKYFAGMQVHAVSGVRAGTICIDRKPAAQFYEDDSIKCCVAANVLPDSLSASRKKQAKEVMDKLEKILGKAGMDMLNVVRTWFYNDNILRWYDDFNEVRNIFYGRKNVFKGIVPASTCIGTKNIFRSAIVAGAMAVKQKTGAVSVNNLSSPMQRSAIEYGSSFSRAVEVKMPGYRQIFVSGTASIDKNGKTVHHDNAYAQVEYTMEVVNKILKSCRLGLSDITRAVAYFKNEGDISAFKKYSEKRRIPPIPLVITLGKICSKDLLFEIELDLAVLLS